MCFWMHFSVVSNTEKNPSGGFERRRLSASVRDSNQGRLVIVAKFCDFRKYKILLKIIACESKFLSEKLSDSKTDRKNNDIYRKSNEKNFKAFSLFFQ